MTLKLKYLNHFFEMKQKIYSGLHLAYFGVFSLIRSHMIMLCVIFSEG